MMAVTATRMDHSKLQNFHDAFVHFEWYPMTRVMLTSDFIVVTGLVMETLYSPKGNGLEM